MAETENQNYKNAWQRIAGSAMTQDFDWGLARSFLAALDSASLPGAYAHRDYLRRGGTPTQPSDLSQHTLIGQVQAPVIVQGFAAMGHQVGPDAL